MSEPKTQVDLNQARVYTIRLPKDTPWQPELATGFINRLLYSMGGKVTLRIIAERGQILWQVMDVRVRADYPPHVHLIPDVVHAVHPQAEVEFFPYKPPAFTGPFYRILMPYRHIQDAFFSPILYPQQLAKYDPLTTLANALSTLQPGERFSYVIDITKQDPEANERGEQETKRTRSEAFFGSFIASMIARTSVNIPRERYVEELQKAFQEKLKQPLFHAYILGQFDSSDWSRCAQFDISVPLREMSGDKQLIELLDTEDFYRQFAVHIETPEDVDYLSALNLISLWSQERSESYRDLRCYFTASELATLWHLPHTGFTANGIGWITGRSVALPTSLTRCHESERNPERVLLGDNLYHGNRQPVFMREDDRKTHMIVFGKTGTGKSTLLHNLIHQDIAEGRGVAVVDPHGNLAQDILRTSIPPHREEDVVVWDLANTEFPPPMNLLGVPKGFSRSLAAAQIMGVLERIYEDFAHTQMADTLQNALETLMLDETRSTLRDVDRLFRDERYRWHLISKLENPAVQDFWQDFQAKRDAAQNEMVFPVLRRVRSFYSSPVLYPILCHPDNLDFYSLMAGNKIILVSLQPTKTVQLSPDSQQLLGALLVSQFQMAAMAEAATQPFHLYVDEAQRFVTTTIGEVFNEARKRKLHIILSNQYLQQLTGDTLKAVMGNVGAMVVFACDDGDARNILPYMKPHFGVEDLVQADKYQAAVVMRCKGEQQPAFSLSTHPAPEPYGSEPQTTEARIRRMSAERYTPKSHGDIIDWLKKRYAPPPPPSDQSDDDMFSEPIT